ncbi:MAG: NnrU family protein, partial [Rhodospirillales bacterium]
MAWLILGLAVWCAAHLFKRLLPRQREALGNKGRGLVALLVAAGLGLMIFGYRAAETEFLYALPMWTWHVNNAAMLVALFLMDIGRVRGV